jgi:hypothetical protein
LFGCTLEQGCQIFLGTTFQKGKKYTKLPKIYQIAIKYAKWPERMSNGRKIYQHLPLQDPQKFTRIGIFGLKIDHPATLRKNGCALPSEPFQFCVEKKMKCFRSAWLLPNRFPSTK